MIARRTGADNAQQVWRAVRQVTRWSLWQHSSRLLIAYVLIVDAVAISAVAVLFPSAPLVMSNGLVFAVLMGCGILYTEMSRPIERVRERFTGSPHIDLNSVWMFAAVLLLHPSLAAIVIATSFFYRWLRVRRHVVHRQAFSAAATIIAALAATGFLKLTSGVPFAHLPRDIPHFALVVTAGLIFLVCNTALVTLAVFASTPDARLRTALGSGSDYCLEAATIALGILLAWALVAWPIALLLIVGITLVLHRGVLIRQLREKAHTDSKTGLLNATAWAEAATAGLVRAQRLRRQAGVLMLDLDHFKDINDRHGHLTGDHVLRSVADVLRAEVRGGDLVGRYGGEEFTVFLPETRSDDAVHIAERIRRRIAAVTIGGRATDHDPDGRVTVSIGVAVYPCHADTLDDLLSVADDALYQAKSAGRNRTLLAPTVTPVGP